MTSALAVWSRFALHAGLREVPVGLRDDATARCLIDNRIGPMVDRALRVAGDPAGDDRFRRTLHEDARTAVERGLAAVVAVREIHGALAEAGIEWLLWKGPALSAQIWDDAARRHLSDLDVVVAPADQPAARAALLKAGWRSRDGLSLAQERAIHGPTAAAPFMHPARGATWPLVELHQAFGSRLYPTALTVPAVLSRADRVTVGAVEVRTPGGADAVLLLAMHATKHGWSQAEEVLSVARLALRYPGAVSGALALAERAGVGASMHLAIGLARALLGVELAAPGAHDDSAHPDRIRSCLSRMEAGDAGWRETHQWTLSWIDRRTDRWRYLARAAFAPTLQEWSWVRLPDALVGAYPLVRAARLALRTLGMAR